MSNTLISAPPLSWGSPGDTFTDAARGVTWQRGSSGWVMSAAPPPASDPVPAVVVQRGASLLTGMGAPSLNVGIAGDSYIDTLGGAVWQRTNAGWLNSGATVTGAQGDVGARGQSMLTGAGEPGALAAQPGDSYLDRVSGNFYVFDATGWHRTGQNVMTGLLDSNGALKIAVVGDLRGAQVSETHSMADLVSLAENAVPWTSLGVSLTENGALVTTAILPPADPARKNQFWRRDDGTVMLSAG